MSDSRAKIAAGVTGITAGGFLCYYVYQHREHYFHKPMAAVADVLEDGYEAIKDMAEDAFDESTAAAIVIQRKYRKYKAHALETLDSMKDTAQGVLDLATDPMDMTKQIKTLLYTQLAYTALPYATSCCACWGVLWGGKKWAQRVKRARELKKAKKVGVVLKAASHTPAGLVGTVLGMGLYGWFG
mmetsp:Transcript_68396/g.216455  ORF Transcript_68396/g.216455 Transcript_68396/m.216455 type:complete len:185 (+) Transcript_68396:115-669(+)|eukprot:CAMPEP_0182881144 /NCGR_PEP_ID=MMETSP0034_2-20130328/17003_1 /TAXON_ID=156128 /ORGANISM="Nephroselmis pyriformis, Strain CCMP717" /LENGTH=184 /DNA_ID=CAMNT_0025014167 /DNA_START=304 /DNA_END=858 /DNA_ORIENTATION=-